MKKKRFDYTGRENLEAMAEAKNYNNFLIGFIKKHTPKNGKKTKILDFGAGSGTYADLLKQDGVVVDCLEPDNILHKNLKDKGYVVLSDVADLKPNSYDVIYALNVLEHIDDDEDMVKKLTAALRKGGKLVIYVPAFQVLFTSMDERVGHFRRYKKNRLKSHAAVANLEVIKLYYCDPIGFGAALAFKWVGNKDGVISASSVKLFDKFAFPLSKSLHPIFSKFLGKNVVLIAKK